MAPPLLVNLSFLIEQPTGLSTYATQLLPHLRPLEPVVLAPREVPGFVQRAVPATLNADHGAAGHLRRLAWTQIQLPRLVRELGGELLFSPIPEAPLWRGCRAVVVVHDLIPLRFPASFSRLGAAYFRRYVPAVLREAQHVLCDSHATADDLLALLGLPPAKITVVPLAHDAARFRFLDLPMHPYFVYLGRPHRHKNLGVLIDAFARFSAAEGRGGWELRFAGPRDPRFEPELRSRAQQLGVADRVQFLGYVDADALPGVLGHAAALVFPSLWEGFGLPALEAMACGTPVVAARRAALPEVAGDAALWIDPEKPADIAIAMGRIACDPALRADLRARGLARAACFAWEHTGRATVEVLRRYL